MTGRTRATTADPLPRTVLSWQRTLPGIAGLAIAIAIVLARAGHGEWAIPVLILPVVPLPLAVRRERQLLTPAPPPVPGLTVGLVTCAACGLALGALAVVTLL